MNIRTPMIRAAVATALAAGAFMLPQTPSATAAEDFSTMSVDTRAPLHATLLPTVSVTADTNTPDGASTMHVAATDALPVTLLPTVFVHARVSDIAAAMPSVVHVSVDMRLAKAEQAALSL